LLLRARRAEPDVPALTAEERDRAARLPDRRAPERHGVIQFILIAVVMVAIAVAWVLIPLLRRGTTGIARSASNVAILRDQLRELDADLAAGTMPGALRAGEAASSKRAHSRSRARCNRPPARPPVRRVDGRARRRHDSDRGNCLLYAVLGNHDAFAPGSARSAKGGAEHQVTPQEVEAMAAKLAARLQNEPDNVDGWVMLARTYYALNRHADAALAFDRAITLVPDNADLLADYADALVPPRAGSRASRSSSSIARSRPIPPTGKRWRSLAPPRSTARITGRRRVLGTDEGDRATGVTDRRNDRRQHRGGTGTWRTSGGCRRFQTLRRDAKDGSGTTIGGTVSLAPALAAKAAPTDTVFIFARAAEARGCRSRS
jgi:cytochrome c-type biogenesis protein CcmH